MEIYFFVSRPEPNVKAFTSDQSGANLPADYAPWDKLRSTTAPTDGDGSPVTAAVRCDGYFLLSGKPRRRAEKVSSCCKNTFRGG
jgi:hypothetical protein